MDLGTVKAQLAAGAYTGAGQFAADVLLTFGNYIEHNDPTADIVKLAARFTAQTNRFVRTWLGLGACPSAKIPLEHLDDDVCRVCACLALKCDEPGELQPTFDRRTWHHARGLSRQT